MPSFDINQSVTLCSYLRELDKVYLETGYRFIKISDGFAKIFLKDTTLILHPNEMAFFPKSTVTEIKFYGSQNIREFLISFRHFPLVERFYYDIQILKITPELDTLFSKLVFDRWPLECSQLGNFYLFLDEAKKHLKERASSDKELQIFKALEYMDKNNIYDIPTLAKLCSMSESRFYSNFKLVTGMTPIEKKHEKQALKAEILLGSTDISIEDVCIQVGFSSMRHFRDVIRKRYGTTPAQLRKDRKKPPHG